MPRRKPYGISASDRAFMDLMNVHTELMICAGTEKAIEPARARELADKIEVSTDVLQRTINRAKRVLEQGVTDDED